MSPRPLPASDLKGDAAVNAFAQFVRRARLPMFVPEWRFAPPRQWRFDFAWIDERVALEVDGGVWSRGRHVRGAGFLKDMEKLNRAAVLGWRVVRCTPDTLCSVETLDMLKALLLSTDVF